MIPTRRVVTAILTRAAVAVQQNAGCDRRARRRAHRSPYLYARLADAVAVPVAGGTRRRGGHRQIQSTVTRLETADHSESPTVQQFVHVLRHRHRRRRSIGGGGGEMNVTGDRRSIYNYSKP